MVHAGPCSESSVRMRRLSPSFSSRSSSVCIIPWNFSFIALPPRNLENDFATGPGDHGIHACLPVLKLQLMCNGRTRVHNARSKQSGYSLPRREDLASSDAIDADFLEDDFIGQINGHWALRKTEHRHASAWCQRLQTLVHGFLTAGHLQYNVDADAMRLLPDHGLDVVAAGIENEIRTHALGEIEPVIRQITHKSCVAPKALAIPTASTPIGPAPVTRTVFPATDSELTVSNAFPIGSCMEAHAAGIDWSFFQSTRSGTAMYSANAPARSTPRIWRFWQTSLWPVWH